MEHSDQEHLREVGKSQHCDAEISGWDLQPGLKHPGPELATCWEKVAKRQLSLRQHPISWSFGLNANMDRKP